MAKISYSRLDLAGRQLETYAAVSAADVRRVVRQYLTPALRSVVTLVPEGGR